MPTKRKVLQKQKQKQSVVVNVNVAKARAKSRAKKSGHGGRGYMLPPPIYASPIDRLTPAMYGSQGQQIQQQSLDQLLKNFLSNQQNQQVGSFKTLGSAPGSSSVSYKPKSYTSGSSNPDYVSGMYDPMSDNVSEMTDPSYMSEAPSPFNNEEKSYLKVSDPDLTAPKFSQNEARVSQQNIYESINNIEPAAIDRSSKYFYDMLNRMEEKTQKEINKLNPQIPEPFRRPDKRPPVRIPAEENYFQNQQGGDAKKRIGKKLEDYEIMSGYTEYYD